MFDNTLSLFVGMSKVICPQRRTHYLYESLRIGRCPCLRRLAILAEFVFHEVVGRVHSYGIKAERTEHECYLACDIALRGGEHCLDIGHHRFEILALVEEHPVPVADLVFPILLPFGECEFLQKAVCADDEHRCRSFESYTAFYSYYSVAHMAVASDAELRADRFYGLYRCNLIVVASAVDRTQLALFKAELQLLGLLLCDVFQVCLLGQSLSRVEQFAATYRRAPYPDVIRVFQFREVGKVTVGI